MAQEKVVMSFPKLIVVELPKEKKVTPFAGLIPEKTIQKVLELNHNGVVHREKDFRINPGEWKTEKLGVGVYKIVHNLGYDNLCLSISLLVQPGSFKITENTPTYFAVETSLDQVPTDLDFSFSLAKVISEPAPQ